MLIAQKYMVSTGPTTGKTKLSLARWTKPSKFGTFKISLHLRLLSKPHFLFGGPVTCRLARVSSVCLSVVIPPWKCGAQKTSPHLWRGLRAMVMLSRNLFGVEVVSMKAPYIITILDIHCHLDEPSCQLITWSKDKTLRFWPVDAETLLVSISTTITEYVRC